MKLDDISSWMFHAGLVLLVIAFVMLGVWTYVEGLYARHHRAEREGEEFLAFIYSQRALDQVIADGQKAIIERWLRR